ncbi:response regulator transcription factor [Pararhodonellum marinum]|uniref:response regulator transcription factor n=1 Tax=Pararhodonellum marinum TaxID=2755358 RepID=UPI00188FF118|nr:response regulator transcription factor [Pararhodonellum marinum]
MERRGNFKILVVEDELIVAMDIQETLLRLGYPLVKTAHSPKLAKETFQSLIPDVVICDINLKSDIDGIELVSSMKRERDFPVIFLTGFFDQKTISRAMSVGASYYLVKPFVENQLQAAIEIARQKIGVPEEPSKLSKKEMLILQQLVEGKTSQEIANVLNNSYHTVTTHIRNIKKKHGLHTSAELISLALKNKWV